MNKNITYLVLIILFLGGVGFIIYKAGRNKDQVAFYQLQDRKGPLAFAPEWTSTKVNVQKLYRSMEDDPSDKKSPLNLATIFIQEARITGNYSYYDLAAMRQVDKVLALDANNFQALTYKSLIYLSQHHFAEGLDIANKARQLNPYNSFIYGILVDANVEMGNYADAVSNAEKMISIKPDLRSYSRISYLREIHGDYPGAIAVMKMAVQAGVNGDDGTEWTRVQLGHLFENTGALDTAEFEYQQALEFRKGFAPALAGLGHIAFARKDYNKAMEYYQQADTLVMDYTNKENLAELYRLTGQVKRSDSLSALVITNMSKDASTADNGDNNIGHYVDRELAYAYLAVGKNEQGLEHALAEYNRRPNNIDVNQTLAWAYYKNADFGKASKYMDVALRTNCKNPTLLCYAGLIYSKAGDTKKGKLLLSQALLKDPAIDIALKTESITALKNL
jgi:tetratricopeptide (TPR) repeat protein